MDITPSTTDYASGNLETAKIPDYSTLTIALIVIVIFIILAIIIFIIVWFSIPKHSSSA